MFMYYLLRLDKFGHYFLCIFIGAESKNMLHLNCLNLKELNKIFVPNYLHVYAQKYYTRKQK